MTQSPLEKLIVLAAASGMSVAEFRSAISTVHTAGPLELEDFFKQVRNRLRHLDDAFFEAERGHELGSSARRDVLALVRAARVPPGAAAELITSQLILADEKRALPPFNQKEGLSRWLERVARAVGDSALLNAAVAAFSPDNRHGHAWTLSRS